MKELAAMMGEYSRTDPKNKLCVRLGALSYTVLAWATKWDTLVERSKDGLNLPENAIHGLVRARDVLKGSAADAIDPFDSALLLVGDLKLFDLFPLTITKSPRSHSLTHNWQTNIHITRCCKLYTLITTS